MRRALTAALLVVAVLGGCGLPSDDGPQAIAPENLPPDLLDPNPGSSTTLPESAGTTTVTVYLLEDTADGVRLVGVDRRVTDASTPNERLVSLFNSGASPEELEAGIRSDIPADTVLMNVTTDQEANEVVIDVSSDFFTIEGEALAQAFAQMVWTATEPDAGGYRQVRFLREGEPTSVPDDELALKEGAVTRADYSAYSPR